MLRTAKKLALRAAAKSGVTGLVLKSAWRRRRLLILCYHSLALADEHLWRPSLYIRAELLARRLELLRKNGCAILPLSDALPRLYSGDLPPRSVAITFDDGTYDFFKLALPLLKQFEVPATVYVCTYYAQFNRPVFDTALSYLLWKAEGRTLDWPEIFKTPVALSGDTHARLRAGFFAYCSNRDLSGQQKDELLAELAGRTGQNYESFCEARMFTLMTAAEIRQAAAAGVAIELHTHRHRVYRDKLKFSREIEENRKWIQSAAGVSSRHFCFPSGCYLPEFAPWLRELGIESAVTCQPGLAERHSNPMLLPRVVDTGQMSEVEFEAWLSGIAAWLPGRRHAIDTWSLR